MGRSICDGRPKVALKKRILLPLIGGGFALGAWLFSSPHGRTAEQVLSAFDTYCLAEGVSVDQAENESLIHFPNLSETAWIEQNSGLVIDLKIDRCIVSVWSPLTVSKRQLKALGAGIALRAKQLGLPDVEGPENKGLPLWAHMKGPFASRERWGIFYTHSKSAFGDRHTSVTYHKQPPPNAPLSNN
jgi:hypothetical protein